MHILLTPCVVLYCIVSSSDFQQLSRLPRFYERRSWKIRGQLRCDPPILSVNKQLYQECSEILYRCNLIVDINCGMARTAQSLYDQLWRGTNLNGRFPFHKAKQITLLIWPHPFSQADHLFHHMLYMCGLLSSEANYIKKLRIQIVAVSYMDLGNNCDFWRDTGRTGTAKRFGFVDRQRITAASIAFCLRPLELPGRIKSCEIAWDKDCEDAITSDTERLLERYKKSLTDEQPFEKEEKAWLWEEYHAILDRQQETRGIQKQRGRDAHTTWLLDAHKTFNCTHRFFGKRYYRFDHQKVECNGCHGRLAWLVDCRHCSLRACARCIDELKKRRSDMEDIMRWEEWKRPTTR